MGIFHREFNLVSCRWKHGTDDEVDVKNKTKPRTFRSVPEVRLGRVVVYDRNAR